MNKIQDETIQNVKQQPRTAKRRHPYTLSNSREETLRRMAKVDERIEEFLEKLNADRKKNAS